MSLQTKNINAYVSTSVLWSIATGNPTARETAVSEYSRVLYLLNPAIVNRGELAGATRDALLQGFAKSAVAILYPALVNAKTETEAVRKMGDSLEVSEIRPCYG